MASDTQVQMRYPAPDGRCKRVRGPVQEITHEDGRVERRQLFVRTTKAMSFQLAVDLKRARPLPVVDGAEAQ